MNVKFKWFTVTGAALMLMIGLAGLTGSHKRPGTNTLIFALMLLVTVLGKPYLPDPNSPNLSEPPLQAGLWDQVDQTRFPQMDLQILCTSDTETTYRNGDSFTTVGVAKRLEILDQHESFALMRSVMFCCIADAYATGLRVPYDDWENIEDNQWVMVSGKLAQETTEITIPNFRFGRAMLSSVNKDYHLRPEKVMSFNWVDQLPLLPGRLGGETIHLFRKALEECGEWQKLEEEGPFTIFVPVDQALENLGDISIDKLSSSMLKQLVSSHIVPGKYFVRDLMGLEDLETISGQVLQVELANGKVRINQSRLLLKNTEARNGVIHYIYPAITPDEWGNRQ